MGRRILCLLAVALSQAHLRAADFSLPLDRPYTLRNLEPALLEARYHEMAMGHAPLAFTFPRPCEDEDGSKADCRLEPRLRYGAPDTGDGVGLRVLSGDEYRSRGTQNAVEAGAIAAGGKGPASFYIDARMFAESGGAGTGIRAYDREDMDVQDKGTTGSASYNSYARYRGGLSLDLGFGRLSVAREAVHWGPGLLQNLTFHQDAVPFHQYSFATRLGPLSVTSIYGDLAIGPAYLDTMSLHERNLYAHRYELRAGPDLLLGVSEQLILYDQNKPWLFTPIFPLFIAKGFMFENNNNGNLSFDACWRVFQGAMIYGEFLIDDMESPSSMFTKDYVQNKWAAMAGAHYALRLFGRPAGLILEYSHIEPWVYSHFLPYTSQSANLGYPLGNQAGANSRSVDFKAYLREYHSWYFSGQLSLRWKGTDLGSGIDDVPPEDQHASKSYLAQGGRPTAVFGPVAQWQGRWLSAFASAELGDRMSVTSGIRVYY